MQATHAEIGDWISQYSDEPDKVREFCVRHGVLAHLRTVVELAERNLPPIVKLSMSMWQDPLEGTERAWVCAVVRSGREEASDSYWRFLREWTQAVSLPERDLIRFSYEAI